MAVESDQVTVGTSATSVVAAGVAGTRVRIRNIGNPGTEDVYLGGSGVTTTSGYELGSGESVDLLLTAGDEVFGIVASGTEEVHVLSA